MQTTDFLLENPTVIHNKLQEISKAFPPTVGGGLLPLGGREETGGYKGYGLNMMVELFCGILGG